MSGVNNLRQSGRTTRTLQNAAAAKAQGERVLIVSPTASIRSHLILMARHLGLLANHGTSGTLNASKDFVTVRDIVGRGLRGFQGYIYEDHTVLEMLSLDAAVEYNREIGLMNIKPPEDLVDKDEEERQRLRDELKASQSSS